MIASAVFVALALQTVVVVFAIRRLTQQVRRMSNTLDTFLPLLDAATNKLANKIGQLNQELAAAKAAGTAPTDEQMSKLQAIADHLTALGADPADPIPAAPAERPLDVAPLPVAAPTDPAPAPAAPPAA